MKAEANLKRWVRKLDLGAFPSFSASSEPPVGAIPGTQSCKGVEHRVSMHVGVASVHCPAFEPSEDWSLFTPPSSLVAWCLN
jgi:hypothetical protein